MFGGGEGDAGGETISRDSNSPSGVEQVFFNQSKASILIT